MKEETFNIEQQLEILKNKEIFKVPENYFEDFSDRLKMRMERVNRKPIRIIWMDYYLKPALSIAAVLAILLFAVYLPVRKSYMSERMKMVQINQEHKTEQVSSELGDSFEALTMLPQSQFLSALEEVEDQEKSSPIDLKNLEEFLADNSSYYDFWTNN